MLGNDLLYKHIHVPGIGRIHEDLEVVVLACPVQNLIHQTQACCIPRHLSVSM